MMNTSLAPEDEFVGTEVEPWARVMFGFLFTVCSVNGVVGCMLISATLWTDKEFRTSSNTYTIYMTSLVITDLYNQAYFFPLIAIDFIIGRYPVVNHAQCVMTAYLIGACYIVFLLTLVAISFDRYLKVCHDVIYRKYISRRTSLIVCVVLWSIGLLSESSSVIMGTLKFERRAHCCLGDLDRTNNPFITMIYVLEAIVVIGLGFPNIMIYRTYRQTRQRVKHWGGGGQKVTVAPSQVTTSVGPQDSDHLQVPQQLNGGRSAPQPGEGQGQGQKQVQNHDLRTSLQQSVSQGQGQARAPPSPLQSQGQGQDDAQDQGQTRQKSVSAADIALLRSLLAVFFCCSILFLPLVLVCALRFFVHVPAELFVLGVWSASVNSSINWIVYGLMNTRFRLGYKRVMLRLKRFLCCDH